MTSNPFDPDVAPPLLGKGKPSNPPVVLPQFPWPTLVTVFMWRLVWVLFLVKAIEYVAKANGVEIDYWKTYYYYYDPDTTCSDAHRKISTKEHCLETNDYYTRPCEYCVTPKGKIFCYNADQAKWSRWFDRAKCEIRPLATRARNKALKRKYKKKRKHGARQKEVATSDITKENDNSLLEGKAITVGFSQEETVRTALETDGDTDKSLTHGEIQELLEEAPLVVQDEPEAEPQTVALQQRSDGTIRESL